MCEFMAKTQPLFFDQNLEASQCAVIGIQKECGQRGELCGSIPTVGAMNHNWCFTILNLEMDFKVEIYYYSWYTKHLDLIQFF